MKLRQSAIPPVLAAALAVIALAVGYRYADLTHHRRPPPPPPLDLTWPGTASLTGTLVAYGQHIMSLRTAQGTFAIILGQSAVALPTCGRYPSLTAGERLEVRVPARGDGTLLAVMVRDVGPCPR